MYGKAAYKVDEKTQEAEVTKPPKPIALTNVHSEAVTKEVIPNNLSALNTFLVNFENDMIKRKLARPAKWDQFEQKWQKITHLLKIAKKQRKKQTRSKAKVRGHHWGIRKLSRTAAVTCRHKRHRNK